MVQKRTISVRETIKESFGIYKRTWLSFIKFALIAVLLSYGPTIYTLGLETILSKKPLYYILGMALLVVLYILFIYYSIRVTMTTIQKLKAVIENRSFDYNEQFSKSDDKFWRTLFVIFIKGLMQGVTVLSIIILGLYLSEGYNVSFGFNAIFIPSMIVIILFSLYMSFRLEFSIVSVYWDLGVETSDFKISFMITKHLKFKKLLLILIAQLPTMAITIFQLWNQFYSINLGIGTMFSWAGLITAIILNAFVFSWSFVVYYVILAKMGCIQAEAQELHDYDDREWISY